MLVPAFSILTLQWERGFKWLAALAFGLGGIALFLTQSRGGWLAFIVALGFFYLLAWRRRLFSPIIHFAAVSGVLALFVIFQDDIATRLFGYDGGAAYSRIPLAQLALHMIRDYPLLGVGANNFLIALPQYVTPEFSREWLFTVHNKYLLVWSETGIFALAAFLWFLLATLQQGWQTWKLNDHLLSPLALGFTLVIVGHMLHMTVDVFNARLFVQMLWLIAGLITAMNNIKGTRAENITPLEGRQT
jgi:putative inorganic carbon (HCO3(-)) transporter